MLRNGRINKVARLRRFRRSTTTPFLCARRPNLASPPPSKAVPARPMGRSGGRGGGCRTPSHLLAVKQAFPPQEPRWHRWYGRLTLSLVERGDETYGSAQCARSQSEAAPSPGGHTHHKELARTPARRRLADAGARRRKRLARFRRADKGPSRHARPSQTGGTAPVSIEKSALAVRAARLVVVLAGLAISTGFSPN
jgi:hypothetical protein